MPLDPRPRYGTARYGQARYTSRSAPLPPPLIIPKTPGTHHIPMSDLTINRLNMISAALGVAQNPTHRPAWQNQPPLAFGTELAALTTGHAAALDLAQRAGSAIVGTAVEKIAAETLVEDLAFQLARALALHFKKTGDFSNHAKVDVAKSSLQRLRDQTLVTRATEIRDLAQGAIAQPEAASRGITAARSTALSAAIAAFAPLVNAPRAQVANRGALLRELKTTVADLVSQIEDLDDLVLQFDTPAGEQFQAAWTIARRIVDAGHGPGEEEDPTPGNNPTPTP